MRRRRDRVILDTNLLISFLINNDFSKLDLILAEKRVILLFSQELLDEFLEVCARPKFRRWFTPVLAQKLLIQLSLRSTLIETASVVNICPDPKDNFLLSLAKDGRATYLITGDKDILALKKFEGAKILTISDYLEKYNN
jgi:putative PIN family toxin of toxin-antitoxin system